MKKTDQGLLFLNKNTDKKEMRGRASDFRSLQNFLAVPSNDGFLWLLCGNIETGEAELLKMNLQTNAVRRFDFPFILYGLSAPVLEPDGSIWFMTDGHLVRFDTRTERWASFNFPKMGMERQTALAIAKTPDGSRWLATEKGLLRAKPAADTFQFNVFRNNPADRNSPSSDNIACLLADPNDPFLLWFGTKGGGLNSFHTKNGQFRHFTSVSIGLPDDVIYGIQAEASGRLWLSSNRGLIRFDPSKNEIKNYRKVDGAQDLEFNTFTHGVCQNGDFMFGGVNGLNIFDSKSMLDNPSKPVTRLTALSLNNRPVKIGGDEGVLTADIGFTEEITVPFSKNNITFEFAALEFSAPSKNRFRYFLEGAEAEWAHESGENFAAYLNLQPGSYVFKVVGSNNDGVFGDVPATLKIRVLAPWYRTNLAYLLYFFTLTSLIYWFWSARENRHRLELKLEKEQREAERAAREFETSRRKAEQQREADREQLALFTQNLMEKNLLINKLQQESKSAKKAEAAPSPEDVEALFEAQILTRKDWESFKIRFERVYPNFIENFTGSFPELTEGESRHIMLLKMGLKTVEVASFLGISPESVKKARQRLRKKLNAQDFLLEELLSD